MALQPTRLVLTPGGVEWPYVPEAHGSLDDIWQAWERWNDAAHAQWFIRWFMANGVLPSSEPYSRSRGSAWMAHSVSERLHEAGYMAEPHPGAFALAAVVMGYRWRLPTNANRTDLLFWLDKAAFDQGRRIPAPPPGCPPVLRVV